jgi:predicted nuclease with RNAse H fold
MGVGTAVGARGSGPGRPLVTLGVDLAGSVRRTSVCRVEWGDGDPGVEFLEPASDDELVAAVLAADKTGLDCPLGWPAAFVALVGAHHSRSALAPRARYQPCADGRPGLDSLRFRLTDDLTWKATAMRPPLSVSTDLLGVVALRAAYLLGTLDAEGARVPRDGSGLLAEVYPAGALRQWRIVANGSYKNGRPEAADTRQVILDALEHGLGRPFTDAVRVRCRRSHDDLDALVCALVARAVLAGSTRHPRTPQETASAEAEGWIHLPQNPLAELVG